MDATTLSSARFLSVDALRRARIQFMARKIAQHCKCLDDDQKAAGSVVVEPLRPSSHAYYCPLRRTLNEAA